MQDIGGQITYARRYSLSAALVLAAEEDNDCDGEKAAQMPQDAPETRGRGPSRAKTPEPSAAVLGGAEKALAGKTKAPLRIVGTVAKIYENEKNTKIMLESGEQLKAWNDATFLGLLSVGKTYEFRCEPSDNPKYPAPTARDAVEVAAPGMDEEVPF
jgi:hypothetical protein